MEKKEKFIYIYKKQRFLVACPDTPGVFLQSWGLNQYLPDQYPDHSTILPHSSVFLSSSICTCNAVGLSGRLPVQCYMHESRVRQADTGS